MVHAIKHTDLSTWIALAAFLLSLVTLYLQHRAGGRANFTAEWETDRSLILVNHGPGAARKLSGTMAEARSDEGSIEAAYVGPYQVLRINYVRMFGEGYAEAIDVTWNDGRLRRQRATIPAAQPQQEPNRPPKPKSDTLDGAVRAIAADEAKQEIAFQVRHAARRMRPF